MKIETITPKMAAEYLKLNTSNRPMKKMQVNFYASQMSTDNWPVTGEAIKFSKTNKLLDGQHRLQACVQANVPFKTYVVRDLPDEIFVKLDTGNSRSATDVLHINNITNPNEKAAIARFVIHYKKGGYSDAMTSGSNLKLTNDQILIFVQKNKNKINEAFEEGLYTYKTLGYLTKSLAGGLFYIFAEVDKEKAHEYFHKLVTGTNLSETSPILQLRNKLIQDAEVSTTKGRRGRHTLALVVKSWNLWRENKKTTRITWDETKEDFPKPL